MRKAGERLRINVQLINIEDGFQLWSDRYDRRFEDIFEIQDDIAGNVVSALKGVFTLDEKEKIRRPGTSIEAYEQFLKGRYYFSILNFPKAQTAFEEAIRIDPGYVPAYALLSNVLSWRYEWLGHKEQDLKEADKYSSKALELSETLAESHISRALVLRMQDNFDEAESEIMRALEIEPNSYDAYYFFARMCFSKGDNKRAAEYFYKASEIRKDDFQSLSLLTLVLRALGDTEAYKKATMDAIRRAERQLEIDPANIRVLSLGAINLLNDGQTKRAFEWQEKVLRLYPEEPSVLINAACFYARAGMSSKALDYLEMFTSQGYGSRSWIEHDPDYESIRDTPRFKELIAKLK